MLGLFFMIIKSKNFNKFTIVSNAVCRDKELSLKAKGLFLTLSSLPEDWVIYKTQLKEFSKDGRDSVIAAFNELVEAGYILQVKKLKPNGTFDGWNYVVYPEKQFDLIQPIPENPKSDNPNTDNTELTNTDTTNKERTKKDKHTARTVFSVDSRILSTVPPQKTASESFQARQKSFCAQAHKYGEQQYADDVVIEKFTDYWTQPAENGFMLFETKQYFDIERRMSMWIHNEKDY